MDKKTKIIVSVIAAVVVVAIIAVVLVLVLGGNSEARQAKNAVETCFKELKAGNLEEANKYMAGDILGTDSEEVFGNEEALKAVFKYVECKVLSAEGEEGKYVVKAEITNKSFKQVFSNYMSAALSLAFSSEFANSTEEEITNQMSKLLIEQYDSEDVGTTTSTVNLTVEKNEDGQWIISGDNDLAEALLPGYQETLESMEALSGIEEE